MIGGFYEAPGSVARRNLNEDRRGAVSDGSAPMLPELSRAGPAYCGVSLTMRPSTTTLVQCVVYSNGSPL